jgi:cyclic pyranopterin phosphate synthase
MTIDVRKTVGRLVKNYPQLKAGILEGETQVHALQHALAEYMPAMIRPRTDNITVAITASCNLRCEGCKYGRDFMPGKQLSLAMVKDILRDAKDAGVNSVRLYGGEPLLHKDLPSMVEYAVEIGIKPYVTTNAVILDRKIDALYAAGLRYLTIGYYGTGKDYEAYTQRAGVYSRMEASIAAVRDRYGDDVKLRLNWLLMRPSCQADALERTWQFAQRYNTPIQVDLIHYSLPYFTEGPERHLQFRPEDRPAIESIVDALIEYKNQRPDLIDHSLRGLRSIPDWLIKGPAMRVPCDKYRMIWIGADGSVQLCYVTFPLGNLHETRLRDILGGPDHRKAAQGAFALDCPNCHCGYDDRIRKHLPSRRRYGS